jgi:CelD/BcsL family acetyltransferase involved in cellulose biosynthesis
MEAFAALEGAWPALEQPHPFADHAWLSAWYAAFADGATPRLAVAWRGDELAAAFPLVARGRRLAAAANYHSPLFAVPARDPEARAAVVDAALDAGAGVLFLHALAADAAEVEAVRAAVAGRRRGVLETPAHVSPIVDTAGDAESWLKARGSTLRRRRRKLEREHTVAVRLAVDADDLERGFELEGSGWKLRNGTAIVSQPATTGFYRALGQAYAQRGELVQGWLDVDGEPIAWHLSLRRGDRLYMLKTGFDENRRDLTPGLILHLLTVERCFADDIAAYELLGDTERWKLDLSTSARAHCRMWVFRHRPVPLLEHAARRWAVPALRRARNRS